MKKNFKENNTLGSSIMSPLTRIGSQIPSSMTPYVNTSLKRNMLTVSHYLHEDMEVPGVLELQIIKAELTRDTDLFGKMDPYVIVEYVEPGMETSQKQRKRTKVCHSQGKTPVWNEFLQFDITSVDGEFTFKCNDHDWFAD